MGIPLSGLGSPGTAAFQQAAFRPSDVVTGLVLTVAGAVLEADSILPLPAERGGGFPAQQLIWKQPEAFFHPQDPPSSFIIIQDPASQSSWKLFFCTAQEKLCSHATISEHFWHFFICEICQTEYRTNESENSSVIPEIIWLRLSYQKANKVIRFTACRLTYFSMVFYLYERI